MTDANADQPNEAAIAIAALEKKVAALEHAVKIQEHAIKTIARMFLNGAPPADLNNAIQSTTTADGHPTEVAALFDNARKG